MKSTGKVQTPPLRSRALSQRRFLRSYLVARLSALRERMDVNSCGNLFDTDQYREDAARVSELERFAFVFRVSI